MTPLGNVGSGDASLQQQQMLQALTQSLTNESNPTKGQSATGNQPLASPVGVAGAMTQPVNAMLMKNLVGSLNGGGGSQAFSPGSSGAADLTSSNPNIDIPLPGGAVDMSTVSDSDLAALGS